MSAFCARLQYVLHCFLWARVCPEGDLLGGFQGRERRERRRQPELRLLLPSSVGMLTSDTAKGASRPAVRCPWREGAFTAFLLVLDFLCRTISPQSALSVQPPLPLLLEGLPFGVICGLFSSRCSIDKRLEFCLT